MELNLPKDVDEKHFTRIVAECQVFDEDGLIDINKCNVAVGLAEKIEVLDDAAIAHVEMMTGLNEYEKRIFYGLMIVIRQLQLAEERARILTEEPGNGTVET